MAQAKKKPAKKSAKKSRSKKVKEVETKADEAQEPQQDLNGVLVNLVPGDSEGNLKIVVQALGNIKMTEAPAILKLASRTAEEQLGIE